MASRSTSASDAISFTGEILAVKARIRLCRSYDQVHHQYQGYTLVLAGEIDGELRDSIRIGIGPAAHAKHEFRIGDQVRGRALPVPEPKTEWAEYYKASGLKIVARGPESEARPADPDGGIAPPLDEYRANGHLRLDKRTLDTMCTRCPFGLTMATEITPDHWNPSRKRWRHETHCYGPRDCPRYRPGKARSVPGRQPGMS
ncbi:MAG: hypothetical protein KDB18_12875 [Salinibacterium sp.]|nr:hypothetical protein [Salinibacterium sp.]